MVELRALSPLVVVCLADPTAVDAVVSSSSGAALRIAPDEALVVSNDRIVGGNAIVADLRATAAAIDADAVVVDATDGWAAWRIEGEDAREAFARVSEVPLGEGFAQGDVAHVRAKIISGDDGIVVLVPATWRDAVRERILADCHDLGAREHDGLGERTSERTA